MGKEEAIVIRVGSRKSRLAIIQTRHVIAILQKFYPKLKFEIHTMTTMGDRVLNISLPKIGEKALFTKDLEDALHSGRVDFVVHSLKDLPTVLPTGMAIGAILEREDPRDALVLRAEHAGRTLQTLPAGSVLGTSSLRRGAQLARKYPHLVVKDIRGNLDTRLAKLNDKQSEFAGIILAQAGLERMEWHDRISQTLDADDILYAVGQGALAVECRSSDGRILDMLQRLSCLRTQCRILAERSFLKTLGGGCSAPVAVITELKRYGGEAVGGGGGEDPNADDENELHITGAVWSLDGATEVQSKLKCSLNLSAKRAIDGGDGDAAEENSGDVPLPAKRARVSATPERAGSNGNSNGGDVDQPRKPASPTVVDDTPAARLPAGADMTELLRIHGELLRKCPFTATHHARNGDGDKCPLNGLGLVVGQDVMGECPYLNAEQKVVASQVVTSAAASADVMGKCPFSPADRAKLTAAAAAAGASSEPSTDGANATKPAAVGCPFAKGASAAVVGGAGAAKEGSCPFLKQSTSGEASASCARPEQLQDEGTVAAAAAAAAGAGDADDAAEGRLFCGLYRHDCYALDLFERCERLGQQLANTLIENGAVKVMECAQQEIRKGI